MSDRYLIPALNSTNFYRVKDTIKRSKFICTMAHTADICAAKAFIARIQEEFPDANHNCWAFQCGPPADTAHAGMSDDGEPRGTAGKPMLGMLLHSPVGELTCVVTRYFGGIKLGTGGLVRAYSGMVKLALQELPVRDKIFLVKVQVILDYAYVTLLQRLLPDFEAEIINTTFTADAEFTLQLPKEQCPELKKALTHLTHDELLFSLLTDK